MYDLVDDFCVVWNVEFVFIDVKGGMIYKNFVCFVL